MNKRAFGIFGLVVAAGVGVLVWKGIIDRGGESLPDGTDRQR
jgi:hypothetical protein